MEYSKNTDFVNYRLEGIGNTPIGRIVDTVTHRTVAWVSPCSNVASKHAVALLRVLATGELYLVSVLVDPDVFPRLHPQHGLVDLLKTALTNMTVLAANLTGVRFSIYNTHNVTIGIGSYPIMRIYQQPIDGPHTHITYLNQSYWIPGVESALWCRDVLPSYTEIDSYLALGLSLIPTVHAHPKLPH